MNEDTGGRRSGDVDISFLGVRIIGPVKALVTLFSGTATILGLIGIVGFHTIESARDNQKIIGKIDEIKDGINLQNAILILPQSERGAMAHRLPLEVQRNFGMVEGR
jgi:hypothetical protein